MFISLYSFSFLQKLKTPKILYSHSDFPEYLEIDEKGIFAEFNLANRLFTWDELTKIHKQYFDLSILQNGKNNIKILGMSTGVKRELPEVFTKTYTSPARHLMALRKFKREGNLHENFTPEGVIVEPYDEMVAEIKKYWKNNKYNI